MLYLHYIAAELRRRRGRTILTALGLGVGVGLVVAVTALSAGLDDAQSEVLEPLTGVGTDMTVARPIADRRQRGARDRRAANSSRSPSSGGCARRAPAAADRLLRPRRSRRQVLDRPVRDHRPQLSRRRGEARSPLLDGVEAVAPALTPEPIHISGHRPRLLVAGATVRRARRGAAAGGPGGAIGSTRPRSPASTPASTDLGLVTGTRSPTGAFCAGGDASAAIVSQTYATENEPRGRRQGRGRRARASRSSASSKAPLGGESSDVYVDADSCRSSSDRKGRVNAIEVRAADADSGRRGLRRIEPSFAGST